MSKHALIQKLEEERLKKDVPDFRAGDTIQVQIRIIEEGGKERLQTFTGTCISRKGVGLSETFTLHRIAYGEGMERVFFLQSPLIAKIDVVRKGQVRRSKLYYLRGTFGKAAKVRGKFMAEKSSEGAKDLDESSSEQSLEQSSDATT